MRPLLLFLIFLTGCTKFAAAYYLHHGERPKLKRIVPCLLIASGVSLFSVFSPIRMIYLRLIIAFLVFLSIYVLMEGSLREKMTVFAVLLFSIESLSLFSSLLLFGLQRGPLSLVQNLLQDFTAILFLLIYGFLRMQVEKRTRIKHALLQLLPLMLIIEAVILLTAVAGIFYITPNGNLWNSYDFAYIMSLLVLISIMGIIWTAVYLFRTNRNIIEYASDERKYAEVRTTYLETLLDREKETRKYRHDFKNHLVYLNVLAEKISAHDILSYLHRLESNFQQMNQHIYQTGNDVIDALMNAYSSDLPDDVHVSVKGIIINTGQINDVDLCIIYSNLLANAVDELKRLDGPEKSLSVLLRQGSHNIGIRIQNTCRDTSPLPVSGILPTAKPDKENHGIGIRNVRTTLKKYHGNMDIERKDGIFSVDVHIPIDNLI